MKKDLLIIVNGCPGAEKSTLARELKKLRGNECEYWIPEFLIRHNAGTNLVNVGNAYTFFIQKILEIKELSKSIHSVYTESPWDESICDDGLVYLAFMRTFTSLNYEIGTPLKQIAFLPHLYRLGVNILLLLPTGKIGSTNRKGERGSPFAISDPFEIDASAADPLISGISAIVQYQALVEACTLLGIHCGSIVPCAGLSLDSPLIRNFPEITYWWDMPLGSKLRVSGVQFHKNLGTPDKSRPIDASVNTLFSEPPQPEDVFPTLSNNQNYWTTNNNLTPATSYPDALGDELATYAWDDIAAVRFSDAISPDFSALDLPRKNAAASSNDSGNACICVAFT